LNFASLILVNEEARWRMTLASLFLRAAALVVENPFAAT